MRLTLVPPISFGLLALAMSWSACSRPAEPEVHATAVFPAATEGDESGPARLAWRELMHTGGLEGLDWRAVERANRAELRARLRVRQSALARNAAAADSLFPGFRGSWTERGSRNQAGSIARTAYDSLTETLYAVGAGGSLWAGDLWGDDWRVVDQSRRFGGGVLEVLPEGRLLADIDAQPVYSDDAGATWTTARGIPARRNGWGGLRQLVRVETPDALALYALSKEGYWEDVRVAVSLDTGATWRLVGGAVAEQFNEVSLQGPEGADAALLLSVPQARLWRLRPDGREEFDAGALFADHELARAHFAGGVDSAGTLVLYALDRDERALVSRDTGRTWAARGTVGERPWSVGLHVDPRDADRVLAGGVELWVSRDGAQTWERANRWSDYYGDVAGSIHADMMSMASYVDADGERVTIVGNHGGVQRSTDWYATQENIGREGLNVGQFYTVRSHPRYPGYFFGGTQDQGFQRGDGPLDRDADLEQAISGDYGHLTFTRGGRSLWMVYPGTQVAYWSDPLRGLTDWYEIDSEDESVWLSPMVAHPDTTRDAVLVAGGSDVDGGAGSYLLEFEALGGAIAPVAYPFDFKTESGGDGELSSLGVSPLRDSLWYAATTNGRFFRSDDAGATWEQTVNFVPSGHYLYGQAIRPSPVADSTVWLAGNGYDNPPVYRSDDRGDSFRRDDAGLPNTLVYELAVTPDGSLLFAATEAGPFVQVVDSARWYPLHTADLPVQTYWSVEWVGADSLARFGTYGRGVWDLGLRAIERDTAVVVAAREASGSHLHAWPNPATTRVTVELPIGTRGLRLTDLRGRQLLRQPVAPGVRETTIDCAEVPRGTYVVTAVAGDGATLGSSRVALQE